MTSYQWEWAVLQTVFSVYMVQIHQFHIFWFQTVMAKRIWYVFLTSIISFSFVIIICMIISIHLPQQQITRIGQFLQLTQSSSIVFVDMISFSMQWINFHTSCFWCFFEIVKICSKKKSISWDQLWERNRLKWIYISRIKIWFMVNKLYLIFIAWQQIKVQTSINHSYCLILN